MLHSELITSVRALLRDADPDFKQHTDAELLRWFGEGYRTMVVLSPAVNTVETVIPLVPGIHQVLPEKAIGLVRPLFNMGADGLTMGRTITAVDPDLLYVYLPNLAAVTPEIQVQHVALDENEPRAFSVYPPQPDPAGHLSAALATVPDLPATPTDPLPIHEIYAPIIVDYVCYRSLLEDADNPVNGQRAEGFRSKFYEGLGLKNQSQTYIRPVREDRV